MFLLNFFIKKVIDIKKLCVILPLSNDDTTKECKRAGMEFQLIEFEEVKVSVKKLKF